MGHPMGFCFFLRHAASPGRPHCNTVTVTANSWLQQFEDFCPWASREDSNARRLPFDLEWLERIRVSFDPEMTFFHVNNIHNLAMNHSESGVCLLYKDFLLFGLEIFISSAVVYISPCLRIQGQSQQYWRHQCRFESLTQPTIFRGRKKIGNIYYSVVTTENVTPRILRFVRCSRPLKAANKDETKMNLVFL